MCNKMSKLWFHVSIALLTVSLAICGQTTTKPGKSLETSKETGDALERDSMLLSIMNECNETFRIEMSYIESLNKSGSFPDETDRTPKCFVRCILEKNNVMSEDGVIDSERAMEFFASERVGTTVDDFKASTNTCSNRNETCMCERSYQFIKCVVETELNKYDTS